MAGRTFSDLDSLIDSSRSFLEAIEQAPCAEDRSSFMHARLVIHEWLANLVQYADFEDRTPRITVRVASGPDGIRYQVDDNSTGFDFQERLESQQKNMAELPNRGMGLMMIAACAHQLSYRRISSEHQRLEFVIPPDAQPRLHIPFPLRAVC